MITLFSAFVLLLHVPAAAANPSGQLFSPAAISLPAVVVDTPIVDTPSVDSSTSLADTLDFNFNNGGFHVGQRKHSYILTGFSKARQIPYLENFSLLDFNRVTGFFLGLGTPGMVDFGKHDEIGLEGGGGYGFASKRWEGRFGGEFRLPLGDTRGWKARRADACDRRGTP